MAKAENHKLVSKNSLSKNGATNLRASVSVKPVLAHDSERMGTGENLLKISQKVTKHLQILITHAAF